MNKGNTYKRDEAHCLHSIKLGNYPIMNYKNWESIDLYDGGNIMVIVNDSKCGYAQINNKIFLNLAVEFVVIDKTKNVVLNGLNLPVKTPVITNCIINGAVGKLIIGNTIEIIAPKNGFIEGDISSVNCCAMIDIEHCPLATTELCNKYINTLDVNFGVSVKDNVIHDFHSNEVIIKLNGVEFSAKHITLDNIDIYYGKLRLKNLINGSLTVEVPIVKSINSAHLLNLVIAKVPYQGLLVNGKCEIPNVEMIGNRYIHFSIMLFNNDLKYTKLGNPNKTNIACRTLNVSNLKVSRNSDYLTNLAEKEINIAPKSFVKNVKTTIQSFELQSALLLNINISYKSISNSDEHIFTFNMKTPGKQIDNIDSLCYVNDSPAVLSIVNNLLTITSKFVAGQDYSINAQIIIDNNI